MATVYRGEITSGVLLILAIYKGYIIPIITRGHFVPGSPMVEGISFFLGDCWNTLVNLKIITVIKDTPL